MRRLLLILTAFYLTFIGGAAYYTLVLPVRLFHHAFVTVLIAIWLIAKLRSGQGLPLTPLNRPIYAAVIVWFITVLTSLDPRVALENLWLPLTHAAFFFILADLFQRGRQKWVMETVFILGSVVVLITGLELASWYLGLGILPSTEVGWADVSPIPRTLPRVALAMNISTLLAGYVAPLITLCAAWALTVRRRDYRIVLWLLAVALLIVLLLTFSRGGLLSVACAVGVLVVFYAMQRPELAQRVSIRGAVGAAALGITVLAVTLVVYTISQDRRSGDEGRVDMWRSALLITRDHPVLGVGPGLYGRAFRDYRDPLLARDKLASAHNVYLNTAAETGLIGAAVALWLGVTLLRSWWKLWQAAPSRPRKLRLEAALAALLGIGIHSLVDVFTITPISLIIVGLAAYCVIGHRTILDPVPQGQRLPAVIALLILIGYGVWFGLQVNPAYVRYINSLQTPDLDEAIAEAQAAEQIDPNLRLYPLQIAYLTGIKARQTGDFAAGIDAYERALELEPTWDVGWLNLGTLAVMAGDHEQALEAFDRARQINPLTIASRQWAALADALNTDAAPTQDDPIVAAYHQAILNLNFYNLLPLDESWWATERQRTALEQFLREEPARDIRYRIVSAYKPEMAEVPAEPQNAVDYWVIGQHALMVENNSEKAISAFTEAINRAPNQGDYYASRARALITTDPDAAWRDLDFAMLFGTIYEYPNAIRADLVADVQAAERLRANASPTMLIGQEFASVMYAGRISAFGIPPELLQNSVK